MTDFAASNRQKLLNLSRETGQSFAAHQCPVTLSCLLTPSLKMPRNRPNGQRS